MVFLAGIVLVPSAGLLVAAVVLLRAALVVRRLVARAAMPVRLPPAFAVRRRRVFLARGRLRRRGRLFRLGARGRRDLPAARAEANRRTFFGFLAPRGELGRL